MSDTDVASEHPLYADWDAAYVLGALTPADRRRFEGHVDVCLRCRTAVAELSGLPGLLAGVPLEQVIGRPAVVDDATGGAAGDAAGHAAGDAVGDADDELPADLLPRLHAAVARPRRRRQVRYRVLAGLAAAAVAVLAVVLLWPGSPPPTRDTPPAVSTLALQAVVPNPLAVDVSFVSEPWGTRVDLKCRFAGDGGAPGPDRDYDYALFLTNRAGVTMSGPSWTYGPDTEAEPVGTSKWPADQIAVVEVRADDGTVLLRATR